MSTMYYAMFHELAYCCADSLIGADVADRTERAWRQVYRSLDHGAVYDRCNKPDIANFPDEIQNFSGHFQDMQMKRHECDYSPTYEAHESDVKADFIKTKSALLSIKSLDIRHKKAFSIYVLLNTRQEKQKRSTPSKRNK